MWRMFGWSPRRPIAWASRVTRALEMHWRRHFEPPNLIEADMIESALAWEQARLGR